MMSAKKGNSNVCAIGRKEPSEEAVDRFIEIYLEIIEENERKAKRQTSK
jgi:hypothetical protein